MITHWNRPPPQKPRRDGPARPTTRGAVLDPARRQIQKYTYCRRATTRIIVNRSATRPDPTAPPKQSRKTTRGLALAEVQTDTVASWPPMATTDLGWSSSSSPWKRTGENRNDGHGVPVAY